MSNLGPLSSSASSGLEASRQEGVRAPECSYLEAAGCRIARHGRGPRAFVGLHGWSGSHASFEPLARMLPEDAVLYAFDLPGVGGSAPPEKWTCKGVVDRVDQALDALALSDVELVAACGGVGFGLHLGAKRPERFRRMVMIDPFAFVPWFFRVFTLPLVGRFFYLCTFAHPLGRALTDGALTGRRAAGSSLTEGFARVDHLQNHRQLLAMCDAARTPLSALQGFSGALDILYGERTFTAVETSVRQLSAAFARARTYRVPGAGHIPMHEATERVAHIVFGRDHQDPARDHQGGSFDGATAFAARAR